MALQSAHQPKLPPELLIGIFDFLHREDPIERFKIPKGYSKHKLMDLMLVCRQFNEIIQSTSSLWTELCLVRKGSRTEEELEGWARWVSKHIEKSAQLPLRVVFLFGLQPFAKVFPIVLPTSPRWEHLTIAPSPFYDKPTVHRYALYFLGPLLGVQVPRLLSLSVDGARAVIDELDLAFQHPPRLVELRWDRCGPVIFRPAGEEQDAGFYFGQRSLEVLTIGQGGYIGSIPAERMIMHRLRLLYLDSVDTPWRFLQQWNLPVLEELRIRAKPYTEVPSSLAVIEFPILTTITIVDNPSLPEVESTPLTDNHLLDMLLKASRKLRRFTITSPAPTASDCGLDATANRSITKSNMQPFLELEDGAISPKYCPDLEELSLLVGTFKELVRLVGIRSQLQKVKVKTLEHDTGALLFKEDLAALQAVKQGVDIQVQQHIQKDLR
ncbi:hypothetical protein FRB90_009210 [Tulasnella sp. 427]|nr:hypothetical protein FRB90_009210 [Tulasnella sp. 427]